MKSIINVVHVLPDGGLLESSCRSTSGNHAIAGNTACAIKYGMHSDSDKIIIVFNKCTFRMFLDF